MGVISLFRRPKGPIKLPNPSCPRTSLWLVPPEDTWEKAHLIVLIEIREELNSLQQLLKDIPEKI